MCGRLSSQHQGSRPLTVYTPDNQSILHSGNGPFSQSSPLVLLPCCLSNSRSKFKSRQKALLMNPCSHNCYACHSSNDNEPQLANMKNKNMCCSCRLDLSVTAYQAAAAACILYKQRTTGVL